jgi:hypothetical protein
MYIFLIDNTYINIYIKSNKKSGLELLSDVQKIRYYRFIQNFFVENARENLQ